MKNLIWGIGLALVAAACHEKAPVAQAASVSQVAVEAQGAASTSAQLAQPPLPSLFKVSDTLTAPMQSLLSRCNLAGLLQGDIKNRQTNPALEGFFGPDHYRFALIFNDVQLDEQNPAVYHVRGKCHYRKNVRNFTGTLTIQQVQDLPRGGFFIAGAGSDLPDTAAAQTYTARARLQLVEENSDNSGVFEGEAVLDFYTLADSNKTDYVTGVLGIDESMPARGSGLLLRGNRLNRSTKQVKKFVVSTDFFAAAPDVYTDFGIGDRGGQINPKYAKLGWDEAWENDEWWADSPKPSLSL
ncbi:hypothetical protein I2I05_18535 [Hymenobacter sp. BT683]|uniref:Lipoprotein n=1 Tax=Hymenobacter jeongseonensis TaxID=2791027 RepID=A0ABS0IMG4_9BACT|nr:hypothetical protein [Hymenobacter jeongseonensis]MBF9239397.1 hypothetical protein [Hymenobacter jeongseonensis]